MPINVTSTYDNLAATERRGERRILAPERCDRQLFPTEEGERHL
jgi:hypothetical protein